jgi:transcription initiation factor TFIID TATA-box-binding protein
MADLIETLAVENVVASTSIDQELNLERLAADLDEGQYDPAHFPGLVYRLQNPKTTSLIFRTGKIVCTGAESELSAKTAIEQTMDELRTLEIAVPDNPSVAIQNIVSTGDLGRRLNLNALAVGFGFEHVEYEPEQFPVVYRFDEPAVVVLLFGSGKLVITGGKQPEDAERAIVAIHAEIEELGLL